MAVDDKATTGWVWEWYSEVTEQWVRPSHLAPTTRRKAEDDMNFNLDRHHGRKARLVEIKPTHESVSIPMRPKIENLHPEIVSLVRRCGSAMKGRDAKKFDTLARECGVLIGEDIA